MELFWAVLLGSATVVHGRLLGTVAPATATTNDDRRILQVNETAEKIRTRCWVECTERRLTAAMCQALIEEELGGEGLDNHEIPQLGISILPQRSPQVFAQSYWFVSIPTDFYGYVACDTFNGTIVYPWDWEVESQQVNETTGVITVVTEKKQLPDVDCRGMTAVGCCNKYLNTVESQGIDLVDRRGNCLSCYIHQEPLEPIVLDEVNGTTVVAYWDQQWNKETSTCDQVTLTQETVQASDALINVKLEEDIRNLTDILESAEIVSCDRLRALQMDLMQHARSIRRAMRWVGEFLCQYCGNGKHSEDSRYSTLPYPMMKMLEDLLRELTNTTVQSDQNLIFIYTDPWGSVIEPPKVGGSRVHLDLDFDDECDDEEEDVDTDTNSTTATATVGTPALIENVTNVNVTDMVVENSTITIVENTTAAIETTLDECIPNEFPDNPFCPVCAFDCFDARFQCLDRGPTGLQVVPTQMPSYTVEMSGYETMVKSDGKHSTLFTYKVCSATDFPIYHVTFQWLGHCILTGYRYSSWDVMGRAYQVHQDPNTCLVGLRFDEYWGELANAHRLEAVMDESLAMEDCCTELIYQVDGKVPKGTVNAAIYVGGQINQFTIIEVEGPDCTTCMPDAAMPEAGSDRATGSGGGGGGRVGGIKLDVDTVSTADDTCVVNDPPEPNPIVPGGMFDPADFACLDDSFNAQGEQLFEEGMPEYSIDLKQRYVHDLGNNRYATKFTYDVCSGVDNPIMHITIGWLGNCILDDFKYVNPHFANRREWEIHLDPISCVSGFRFDAPWDCFVRENTTDNDVSICSQIAFTMDGIVPVSTQKVPAAIVIAGAKYRRFDVDGPDCTECVYPPVIQ